MAKFKASVQNNDLKGSVAADRADGTMLSMWLREHGEIEEDEYVIGTSMFAGENHGTHQDPVFVTFYVTKIERKYDTVMEMISAKRKFRPKKIEKEMSIADFLSLFKRFEITLSIDGRLEDKDIV